jgi:hypothetical protein
MRQFKLEKYLAAAVGRHFATAVAWPAAEEAAAATITWYTARWWLPLVCVCVCVVERSVQAERKPRTQGSTAVVAWAAWVVTPYSIKPGLLSVLGIHMNTGEYTWRRHYKRRLPMW